MKKKFLAVLLAGVLTVGTASVPQLALTAQANGVEYPIVDAEICYSDDGNWGYYIYEMDSVPGVPAAFIVSYQGKDVNVTIPDTLGGEPVRGIESDTFGSRFDEDSPAFYIESVTIPEGVISIENYTFMDCIKLKKVSLPSTITDVGSGPFAECKSLETIEVAENNPKYKVENDALIDKTENTLVRFPQANKATEYVVPDGVKSIDFNAFYGCENLTKVTLPDSVTKINFASFEGCKNLKEISLPDHLEFIDGWAFCACESLTELTIPGTVTTIETHAFDDCISLEKITVDENNPNYFSSEDGVLFDKDKKTLLLYPSNKKDTEYSIPDGVTTIATNAFIYCNNLNKVIIPNSVTTIEIEAFTQCDNLTEVTIPNTVKYLKHSFCSCSVFDIIFLGTIEEWSAVDVMYEFDGPMEEASYLLDKNTVICTDGTVVGKPETEEKPSGGSSSSSSSGSTTTTTPEPTEYTDAENETGVTASADEGVLPDGAELVVTPVTSETSDSEFTYDISFKDTDGKEVQPNGNVTVKVPVPEKFKDAEKVYVYRAETDGTYTDMKAEVKDGFVVFTTNHFSKYVLTTEEIKAETPAPETPKPTDTTPADTTTNPNTGVAVALIPAILAGAVVIVSAKKRK